MSLLFALLLQVGPNPLSGSLEGADDLVRDRPPRNERVKGKPDAASVWFERCFDQLETDPARAHTMAQIRRSETTGAERVLANHCLGTASAALGLWDDARAAFIAARLETPDDEARTRARFAVLAGNAALASGDAAGAFDLLTLAESGADGANAAPLAALAATDKARALVMLGRTDEALAALDTATVRAPERAEGWLLKATLLRRLDRLNDAQAAIEQAAQLTPGDPEIGLEAGVIAVLAGRDDAARQSWQSVIALAPDSSAAATAKEYLAQLGDAGEALTPVEDQKP